MIYPVVHYYKLRFGCGKFYAKITVSASRSKMIKCQGPFHNGFDDVLVLLPVIGTWQCSMHIAQWQLNAHSLGLFFLQWSWNDSSIGHKSKILSLLASVLKIQKGAWCFIWNMYYGHRTRLHKLKKILLAIKEICWPTGIKGWPRFLLEW